MSRYTVVGNWSEVDSYAYDQLGELDGGVVVESCTLVDTRDGRRYVDGAYRVRFVGDRPRGFRARTWKGEEAGWDATRYFRDAVLAARMGGVGRPWRGWE